MMKNRARETAAFSMIGRSIRENVTFSRRNPDETSARHTLRMVATAVFLMAVFVAGVLLVGIVLSRSRVSAAPVARRPAADASWVPAIFSDGGGIDCSPGDAGCDGGGGGGGD
jgi:hypothetical protein